MVTPEADDLAEAIRDLYQRRPDDFVAARQALTRSLRQAGRRDDAQRVQSLRKPTAAAWAVNRLAGRHAGALEQLLGFGAELRGAQMRALRGRGGEALRELGRRRGALVEELAGLAVEELRRLGAGNPDAQRSPISSTLEAAVVDEDLAATVAAGLLTKEASAPAGLGLDTSLTVVPPPPEKEKRGRRATQQPVSTRARVEVERAQRDADEQRRRARDAAAEENSAARAFEEANHRVSAARKELAAAQRGAESAEERAAKARRAMEEAARAADRAERRARRLTGESGD
jgi:hypothetical protein